jgi:hypothetical protein
VKKTNRGRKGKNEMYRRRNRWERVAITTSILSGNLSIKDVAKKLNVHPVVARSIALNTIVQAHRTRGTVFRDLRDIYGTRSIIQLKKKFDEIYPFLVHYEFGE